MKPQSAISKRAIERVAQQYRDDGYAVHREAIVDDVRVDLWVVRDREERVIELIAPGHHITSAAHDRLEQWRVAAPHRYIDVHVLSEADLAVSPAEPALLRSKLRAAESLLDLLPEGSFLTAWAVFEASARANLLAAGVDPPGGAAIVRALIQHGVVEQEIAPQIAPALHLRNALVHGSFDTVDPALFRVLVAAADRLLQRLVASSTLSKASA